MHFTAKGHENVLSLHRNTVEFTHETHLTKRGDCILAVCADYSLNNIKKEWKKIKIHMKIDDVEDEIIAEYNPEFSNPHEMVIRKTEFSDQRTFAIKADKAAKDIKRELVARMRNPEAVLHICISSFYP
jgi:hypothetical protein